MKILGIVRCIDNLGRLVIPKEMRDIYNLDNEVEIISTDEGILVRNPRYVIEVKENKKKEE